MSAILKVPPELFPLVASNISLQLLPSTLSALALTAKSIYSCVNPVLYSKVIVVNEDHACSLLERISTTPTPGPLIREFHLQIDLEGTKRRTRFTVLVKLQEAIEQGCLPTMNFLRLVMVKFQNRIVNAGDPKLNERYYLPGKFWTSLRRCCPLLRGLCVDGVGDCPSDLWVNEPEFYDMKNFVNLQTLSLKFEKGFPQRENSERLCRNLINLASTLQSLTLFFEGRFQDPAPLFSITFPCLTFLSMSGIGLDRTTIEEAMNFWSRHPNLERVSVRTHIGCRWFADGTEAGLLPKLTHLRAPFEDVRALASHLGQLEHLCVTSSLNWQVPYLLRSVLPEGLPNLKSLEIHQKPYTDRYAALSSVEGATWYETEAGEFCFEKRSKAAAKYMDGSYTRSIVQGAPNLQQLCFQYPITKLVDLTAIVPMLARLSLLERFYYQAFPRYHEKLGKAEKEDFLLKCRLLGNACKSLKAVTDVGFYLRGPYLVGNIIRDCGGEVEKVVLGRGFGMVSMEGDNDPFPVSILA